MWWSSPRIGWKLVSQNFVFLCVRDATRDALMVVVCVFVRVRRETQRVDVVVCVFCSFVSFFDCVANFEECQVFMNEKS